LKYYASLALVALLHFNNAAAFGTNYSKAPGFLTSTHVRPQVGLGMKRYGPTGAEIIEESVPRDEARVEEQKNQFRALLRDVITVADRADLPSILSRNIDMLVDLRGYEAVALCKEALGQAEASGNAVAIEKVTAAVDYIVYFVETFVSQAKAMDDQNKATLYKILKRMTGDSDDGVVNNVFLKSDEERATALDDMISNGKESFTPGFLRYLDGECNRIASTPDMSEDTARLLEILRVIQLRIVEELGKGLGEGALVLGQLLGYKDRAERIAVLDAGLQVRGVEFATELASMSEGALAGFQQAGADPALVTIVSDIHQHIVGYIQGSRR